MLGTPVEIRLRMFSRANAWSSGTMKSESVRDVISSSDRPKIPSILGFTYTNWSS